MMKKEFAHMKVRFIVLAVILAVLFVVSFPLGDFLIGVAENALSQSQISGLEGLQEVLGKIREDFNFNAYSQWFGKNLGQLVPIFSIIIGFPIFSREVERKTIYFLLTKQRRRRVFRVKYFLGLFAVTALIFCSSLRIVPDERGSNQDVCRVHTHDAHWRNFLVFSYHSLFSFYE